MSYQKDWKAAVLGHAVGDALGVPVEFESREFLQKHPVSGMQGYGSYNVPKGTWSDDTSLTLATIDSLQYGLDYNDIMEKFCAWANESAYTPYGEVFDMGVTTKNALLQYMKMKTDSLLCGGKEETDNGNGSLMRILPAVFYCKSIYKDDAFFSKGLPIIHNISALTHAHPRSQIACGIYSCILSSLLDTHQKSGIIHGIQHAVAYYQNIIKFQKELSHFSELTQTNFFCFSQEQIKSSGYVVDTLQAAVWCLLTTDNYCNCVLKAVNLGEDTDTVAAVAGGLAGVLYGLESIPVQWLSVLAKHQYIECLCDRFAKQFCRNNYCK